MLLKEIYRPIEKELRDVERILENSLQYDTHKSILEINEYLLGSKGKRLRPALVILCAKASSNRKLSVIGDQLVKTGAAMELIHMASLIHDDVIDHSRLRHDKPTINSKWGEDVSIAAGDYLYSVAFELISTLGNNDILECISSATKVMSEGELIQICERDNLNLLRERYLMIVKKKTASLFAASCEAGAILVNKERRVQDALKGYGMNFGIAFQIVDDCLDLIGTRRQLGKSPGDDFKMGELTLPVLNLISQKHDKEKILSLLSKRDERGSFRELRKAFIHSPAFFKTKEDAARYIRRAKSSLEGLNDSSFKEGLTALADYVARRLKI